MIHYWGMIPRRLQRVVDEVRAGYPVIAITGPRQSGKTTLAQHCFPDKPYVTLENPIERQHLDRDPEGFLRRFSDGAIFDEAQHAPQLFSFLQGIVDRDKRMGHFVLTGSQQFGLMERITQSLAGRIARIELLPFSLGELKAARLAVQDLDELMLRGGYPVVFDRRVDPSRWYGDYFASYVQRDVRQALQVRDLQVFSSFVHLCAAQVGQLTNFERLGNDLGVDGKTIRSWLSVLEASYIIKLLRPYHASFRKRVVKSSKLYFLDTGLLCRLLEVTELAHLRHHPLRGHIVENWVLTELIKGRFERGLPSNLYFWRSHEGLEVDVVVEQATGLWPIEIKAAVSAQPAFVDAIEAWRKIAKKRSTAGTVIYAGDSAKQIGDTSFVPWHHVDDLAARL